MKLATRHVFLAGLAAALLACRAPATSAPPDDASPPSDAGAEREAVEASRRLDGPTHELHVGLLGGRGELVGVVGEVRLVHPRRARGLRPDAAQIAVDRGTMKY